MIPAEDLPLAVRRKLGLDTGKSSKRSRAGVGEGAVCRGRCASCGQEFAKFTDFMRTHRRTGHARWEIDLDAR